MPFAQEVSKLLCERPEEFGPSVLGVFCSLANHAGKAAFRKVSDEQILSGVTLGVDFRMEFTQQSQHFWPES